VAAIFHLFTHAFFKALLFLGSGSVNHSTNTFDMRLMGGLRKTMPVTFATFLVGSLSLAGVFPLAGFWSKDEILNEAWHNEKYLWVIGVVTAGLTAFYMTRVICMTFLGEYRGGGEPEHEPATVARDGHSATTTAHHASTHESPPVMALPLMILAVPAIIAGAVQYHQALATLLDGALPNGLELPEYSFNYGTALLSTAVALGGIGLGLAIYQVQAISATALRQRLAWAHNILENKYYADYLYERVIVGFVFYELICGGAAWFDANVVEGVVNGAGKVTRGISGSVRYIQSGQFQTYGLVGFASVVFAVILVLALHGP
jgi:NADH:ubiquinone oxidoreductase subunit 5 (subunit L)/multisubunit Na+/H+ antiporter MnhA subunit